MAKVTTQEKIQAVKRYLEGKEGQKSIARSIGVSHSILLTWIRQYEHHGEQGFENGYTTYSVEDKLKVLHYINEHGTSIREAAAIFNIPTHSLVLRWKNQLETEGVDALKSKKKGRPSMKEESKKPTPVEGFIEALQAEIERLRMENTYLKKLNALVQSKEKSQSKTK
ncbi:transposase [Paenibacillus sp. RC254]